MSGDLINADELWELVQQEHRQLTDQLAMVMGAHPDRLEIVAGVDDHLNIYGLGHSLPELLDRVTNRIPTILHRHGLAVAAIVPIDDFDALNDATDEMAARRSEAHAGDADYGLVDVLADLLHPPPNSTASKTIAAPASSGRRALTRRQDAASDQP
ncbi:hypothetical protein AB0M29_45200 [Streptomyces sp. NPDC051976]|uniref:hypothetical protein n=1 Tax=Streptomyces sp. NPDC051976 TaxID=3154947 RepID=UPI0034209F05